MATALIKGTTWSSTLWVLILIIGLYFVTNYFVYLRQTKRWEKANIPFLQPTFLIGHKYFLRTAQRSIYVSLDQIYKENKKTDLIGFFLGPMPFIMLKDQTLIRQIFAKHSSQTFKTSLAVPESEVELQHSVLFTTNEERWKFSRTVLLPVFSLNWFQGPRFEGIKEAIDEFLHNAEKIKSNGSPINVKEVAKYATSNVVISSLGIDSHSHAVRNRLRTILKESFSASYRRLIIFLTLPYVPFLQIFEPFKVLSRNACNNLSDILQQLIKERDHMNIETGDFVDLLRSFRANQKSKNSCNVDSDSFSIEEGVSKRQMTGLAIGIMAGAAETVSGLVNYAVHSLSLYPEYQLKIRREIHEAMKKHGVSELNFDVIRSLSFTYQCIFEASRLHPSVPFIMRQVSEDFQIQGTKYIFRKGDKVILPMYSAARDEKHFQNPHSFNPERFKSKDTNLALPATLLSFGSGPRKCPGYTHGVFVTAAFVAALLYKYEIKPRSHLKLMDASDYHPKASFNVPRREFLVDLVRCEDLDDV